MVPEPSKPGVKGGERPTGYFPAIPARSDGLIEAKATLINTLFSEGLGISS